MPAIEASDAAGAAAGLAACVREAGLLALSMFGKPLKNWTKGASSPVCEADIAVELKGPTLGDSQIGGVGGGVADGDRALVGEDGVVGDGVRADERK